VDVIRAAFAAENVKAEFDAVPYVRGVTLLQEGKGLALFNTVKEDAAVEYTLYSVKPLLVASVTVWGAATNSAKVTSLKDLEGKKVGITNGYEYGTQFAENKKIIKVPNNKDVFNLKKLAAGNIDYTLVYDAVAPFLISENKAQLQGKIKQMYTLQESNIYLSFSKKHPKGAEMKAVFDKGFKKIQEDGTYKKLQAEWKARFSG
jgi:polar amino acid transport system substrate-binding protein